MNHMKAHDLGLQRKIEVSLHSLSFREVNERSKKKGSLFFCL